MTHFRVLVLSNDYETALEPYNEQDETFFTPHDDTESLLKDYARYGEGRKFAEFIEEWNGMIAVTPSSVAEKRCIANHQSYAIVDENGNCIKCIRYYNDDAKWDWYTKYGRWNDEDIIYKDTYVHIEEEARVKDIDFEAMYMKAREVRAENYDEVFAKMNIDGKLPSVKTWEEFTIEAQNKVRAISREDENRRAKIDAIWEEASKAYDEQEAVKKFRDNLPQFFCYDNFVKSREEYIDEARLPFQAICTDNEWCEKASMGWWGIEGEDKMTAKEFAERQMSIVRNIEPDTIVNLIDCHI